MKNIDKLIINSPYEEPQQCGWVKRSGLNTYLLIIMEEDTRKIERLGDWMAKDKGAVITRLGKDVSPLIHKRCPVFIKRL